MLTINSHSPHIYSIKSTFTRQILVQRGIKTDGLTGESRDICLNLISKKKSPEFQNFEELVHLFI